MDASTLNVLNISDCRNNEEVEQSLEINERRSTFLDYAKIINHGKFLDRIVDDVKSLQNAVIICILVIPYWIIFAQVKQTKFLQNFYHFLVV